MQSIELLVGALSAVNSIAILIGTMYLASFKATIKKLSDNDEKLTRELFQTQGDLKAAKAVNDARMEAITELKTGLAELTKEIKTMKEEYSKTMQEFYQKYNLETR
jgi:septal ring factor EnvC (AmiA/AmiB activator)